MKTITEFPALNLKNAARLKQELLASGKTAEELPQAMGESLKLEGDRLGFILSALELIGTRLEDLRRVVVYSLAEGEKAPAHAQQKGDHYYLVENHPPLNPPQGRRGKPGFDGKRGGKGDGKRGGKRDGKRGGRPPRGAPHPKQAVGPDSAGKAAPGPRPVIRPVIQPVIRPVTPPKDGGE